MLPSPTAENFPEALKAAREAKGLSFTELARRCEISPVMPSRYENRDHSHFGPPSEKTWRRLNEVLFGEAAPAGGPQLSEVPVEELVAELKRRGAVSVVF